MIAKKLFLNFGEGTTNDKIDFSFQLYGKPEEIDYIDYGTCPCVKGEFYPENNKIKGVLNLSGLVTHGGKYIMKYIKVYLNQEKPERIAKGRLDTDNSNYVKNSFTAVNNPTKEFIQFTIAGDVNFEEVEK
jgi:hypothetical protein